MSRPVLRIVGDAASVASPHNTLGSKRVMTQRLPFALALVTCALCAGCSSSEEKPRPAQLIHEERRALPVLYLTEKSQQEVIRSAAEGLFVEEKTGELCYRAYYCTSPDCPNKDKTENGRPVVFIHRNPTASVGADGEIIYREVQSSAEFKRLSREQGSFLAPTCPACWELRDPDSETPRQTQQYINYVQPYTLPESAKRAAQLDEEHQQRLAHMKQRRHRQVELAAD